MGAIADPYDAAANPDFRAALVAYWLRHPALVAISPAPYADEAGDEPEDERPYCVLSQVSAVDSERGSRRRAYRQDIVYQFAVYHPDQDRAVDLGLALVAALDPIEDMPLRFANGYQRAWFHQTERLLKVPAYAGSGALTIWQQAHLYKATLGRYRRR